MCYLKLHHKQTYSWTGDEKSTPKIKDYSKSTLSLKNGTVTFCGRKGFSPDTGLLPRYWSNVTKKTYTRYIIFSFLQTSMQKHTHTHTLSLSLFIWSGTCANICHVCES